MKVAVPPEVTVCAAGLVVTTGAVWFVRAAGVVVALPTALVNTASYS